MRFVATSLLIVAVVSTLRASTDRVHPSHSVRSTPGRLLLLTIAGSDDRAPTSPSRREHALESALDEEEASDLDPLDAPFEAITRRPPAGPRREAIAALVPLAAMTRQDRPFLLRC